MSTPRRQLTGLGISSLLLALTLAATAVVIRLGDRYNARLDVTTTREQQLAPRTLAVLDRASMLGDVEIVVAVDVAALEPWSRRTVADVLDLFQHTGSVRTSEIDVGSAQGQVEFGSLLDRLIAREQEGINTHIAAMQHAAARATAVAATLDQQITPTLRSLRDTISTPSGAGVSPASDAQDSGGQDAHPTTQTGGRNTHPTANALGQWATLTRSISQQLSAASTRALTALSEPDPTLPIPPLHDHEAALGNTLQLRANELEALAGFLDQLAASGTGTPSTASTADTIARTARTLRDTLARDIDTLSRLPRLDVLRVAKALGSAEVALVIGPPGTGVTGIDIAALYEPQVVASDGSRLIGDVRFQAEELFANAVASTLSTAHPIVVLTHGESQPILDRAGFFTGIRQRLSTRGIDLTEWTASQNPEPPTLTTLDPDAIRPVVFVILSPDSSASARNQDDLAGPERAPALGRAVALLLERREAVLLSVNPSILPSYGEADPITAPLTQLGLTIATDTPLLKSVSDTRTRQVLTEMTLRANTGSHPILAATRNLRTTLSWPVAITANTNTSWHTTPLLVADNDPSIWGESQWLPLWQTPREQRGLIPGLPIYNEDIDQRGGPWTVALAAERTDQPQGVRAGRVVVVGSNAWFADPIAFARQETDGRLSLVSPGNAELFEAAVLWLAGEDELIAQSAGARATPLVGSISPGTLSALRWALVAGLPLGTLALGMLWRMVKG